MGEGKVETYVMKKAADISVSRPRGSTKLHVSGARHSERSHEQHTIRSFVAGFTPKTGNLGIFAVQSGFLLPFTTVEIGRQRTYFLRKWNVSPITGATCSATQAATGLYNRCIVPKGLSNSFPSLLPLSYPRYILQCCAPLPSLHWLPTFLLNRKLISSSVIQAQ